MQDLQTGDFIKAGDICEEVKGRISDLVFTQRIFSSQSHGSVQGPFEISDLETYGYQKITLEAIKNGELR